MEKEHRPDIRSIEREKSGIKFEFQYKDTYGRLFGRYELEKLEPLPDPSSNEVTYLDGSVETPFGDFMLECKISEAKETLAIISEFIRTKEEIADLEEQLKQAVDVTSHRKDTVEVMNRITKLLVWLTFYRIGN